MRKTFLIMILLFSCAATLFAYSDYGVDPNGGPFFDNYKQLFTFIAKLEGLPADPDTIRKLAEESTIEPIGQLSPGRFIVIDVEYMGKEFSKIRSFHNNGSYYILLKNKKNFKLVGCVVGNRYRWDIVEDRIRIIVNYHFSIEPCEAVYLWNGKSFQPISPPDSGSKTHINSPCPTSNIDYHILKLGLTDEKTIFNVYKWALEQFADGPLDSSDWAMYVADRGLMEAKVDLDFDGMPELFLRQNAYARNHLYQVFSLVKGGYRYLGNFSGRHFKILPLNKDKKPEILVFERCHGPLCFIKKYMNNGKKFTLVSSEELSVGDDAPKENNKKLYELFGNFEKSIVFTSCKTVGGEGLYTQNSVTKLPEVKGKGTKKWTVWLADGRSDPKQLDIIPAKSPLGNYRENMALIHPWDFGKDRDVNDPTRIKLGEPNVTYIGKWEEYVVYDLTDHENVCKQIMLKDKSGNHKIIYSQLPWCTANVDDLPYIVTIQGIPVLVYRTRVSGTGHFFIEYYFIYHKKNKRPIPIDMSAIVESLSRILPKGYSVWKGGGFNIEKMTFSHAVWKKGDGNCCPTGGRVDLKLSLKNGKIIVIEERYDPQYDWNSQQSHEKTASKTTWKTIISNVLNRFLVQTQD